MAASRWPELRAPGTNQMPAMKINKIFSGIQHFYSFFLRRGPMGKNK
jgi:hypothetical protein